MMTSLIAAILFQATPPAAAVCAAPVTPPAGLEAWSTVSGIATDPIEAGRPTDMKLQPVAVLTFALPPERSPTPGTFGGVYHVTIATAGTYRIALAAGAWIDLVRDGEAVATSGHMEGAPCSGIRKIVDFVLDPGTYTLQLSGAKTADMRLLIAAK
ncbi:MAG TPA: hypothetical protein VF409_11305 [Sphingomonas sp.]